MSSTVSVCSGDIHSTHSAPAFSCAALKQANKAYRKANERKKNVGRGRATCRKPVSFPIAKPTKPRLFNIDDDNDEGIKRGMEKSRIWLQSNFTTVEDSTVKKSIPIEEEPKLTKSKLDQLFEASATFQRSANSDITDVTSCSGLQTTNKQPSQCSETASVQKLSGNVNEPSAKLNCSSLCGLPDDSLLTGTLDTKISPSNHDIDAWTDLYIPLNDACDETLPVLKNDHVKEHSSGNSIANNLQVNGQKTGRIKLCYIQLCYIQFYKTNQICLAG